jgi:drug/metabolite transporter (DMT)-like permease
MMLLSGLGGVIWMSATSVSVEFVLSNPFIAVGWPELTLFIAGFAVLASILNLAGNICLSRAYQTADASMLAPLDFVYLLFAAVWSRILFDQWPSAVALAGMTLIASAGALTAWREHVRR